MVMARLDICVYVSCPSCNYRIDLMNPDDTSGVNHNEGGGVINHACPSGPWMDVHQNFQLDGVVCTKCKHSFNVNQIEW